MNNPDLVEDLYRSDDILAKVREDKRYAQNLYAAFCNMRWQKLEVVPILTEQLWSCSWRSAGGIVAKLRNASEDYMDYYCSGMGGFAALDDETAEEAQQHFNHCGHVPEGTVTDEIREDLKKIGWVPNEWPKDE
jgi:hypothetical protein